MQELLNTLTTKETAELLGVGPRWVVELIYQGRLPAVKRSRDWLIDPAHLPLVANLKAGRPPGSGKRKPPRSSNEATPEMRSLILHRDGGVCQYCGDRDSLHVVEHVVWNGLAFEPNLVEACRSCNTKKKREIWVPQNFEQMTVRHLPWRELVLRSAVVNYSPLSLLAQVAQHGEQDASALLVQGSWPGQAGQVGRK